MGKLEEVVNELKKETGKECYSLKILDEEPEILDNKIGGKPYLPVGEEYPKSKDGKELALILQINLKDIKLEGYPQKGILEIYTDIEVKYPSDYQIKYFKDGLEYQTDLPELDLSKYIIERGHKIALEKTIAYMTCNDYRFFDTINGIIQKLYNEKVNTHNELEDYFNNSDWYDQFYNLSEPWITIGGWPDFTQYDPREKGDKRTECLFKLDSNYDMNTIYLGDAGIMFALISKEDIINCNFNNALLDWDCC